MVIVKASKRTGKENMEEKVGVSRTYGERRKKKERTGKRKSV